ncbi:MAG: SPASM domain-containing protein [Nitrospinota bacterium]|nr:SPASM domain-containing protein [Nitrospinota bacterium]
MRTRTRPAGGAIARRMVGRIGSWHVAFSQDCNLRCRYCVTGHGAMGEPPAVMTEDVWSDFVSMILDGANPGRNIFLSFGCGETFLHFDRFIGAVDHMQKRAEAAGVKTTFEVTTNGTLLDEAKLQALARRRIFLTFSVDGPAMINDANRMTISGDGVFHAAIANWERYKEITSTMPNPPSINVQSVIADGVDLYEVARFWREKGQGVFMDLVAEPPFNPGRQEMERWESRRAGYLASLERLAMDLAGELSVPSFLSEYRGPKSLFDIWFTLFFERSNGACGAGVGALAMDARGRLYPCEKFIGNDQWIVGDISLGVDGGKMAAFRMAADALVSSCVSCTAAPACHGGCLAATPADGLSLNHNMGCDFARKVEVIARKSFDILCAQ